MAKKTRSKITQQPQSPLDLILLHFPEVRQGTIISWMASSDGVREWHFRMPDASYCKVRLGFKIQPTKTPVDPDLADRLEQVWHDMGDDALGKELQGWRWASDEFSEVAEDLIIDKEGLG
jgi:hypothetical protein